MRITIDPGVPHLTQAFGPNARAGSGPNIWRVMRIIPRIWPAVSKRVRGVYTARSCDWPLRRPSAGVESVY